MTDSTNLKPPKGLSREGAKWWRRILEGWELDDPGLMLLENALTAFDRMREAQKLIRDEGIVTEDRFGQAKPHPATTIERDAKQTMLRNLKAVGLDLEPLNAHGRPPGS